MRKSLIACFVFSFAAVGRGQGLDPYGGALSNSCTWPPSTSQSIASISEASGTYTAKVASTSNFYVKEMVFVAGVGDGYYNSDLTKSATAQISAMVANTSISYTIFGDSATHAASNGGTIIPARWAKQKIADRAGALRWYLCTPLGHAYYMQQLPNVNGAAGTDADYYTGAGINLSVEILNKKFAVGAAWDNIGAKKPLGNYYAYHERLLKAYGYNATGIASDAASYPTSTDATTWPAGDHSIPDTYKVPFYANMKPTYWGWYNFNRVGNGPAKSTVAASKRYLTGSWYTYTNMGDAFDPNLWSVLAGMLNSSGQGSTFQVHNDYVMLWDMEETDNGGWLKAGWNNPGSVSPKFQNWQNGAFSSSLNLYATVPGWMWLIAAPYQTGANKALFPIPGGGSYSSHQVYADPVMHTKQELANWLQQTGDRGPGYTSITALNAAWGSNYDSFGSDAVDQTDTLCAGQWDGVLATCTFTLAHVPLTPFSVQILVNGTVVAADDGYNIITKASPQQGNFVDGCPPATCSNGSTSTTHGTVRYDTGMATINFTAPLTIPPNGAMVTAQYKTGGWASGNGLLDEDGTHAWIGNGVTLQGEKSPMQTDLLNFSYHYAKQWAAKEKATLTGLYPNVMLECTDGLGGRGTPPWAAVMDGIAPYCDLYGIQVPVHPDPNHTASDAQLRLDFLGMHMGDLPIMYWGQGNANPASIFCGNTPDETVPGVSVPCAAGQTGTGDYATQEARGAGLLSDIQAILAMAYSSGCVGCSFVGTHPSAGHEEWQMFDDASGIQTAYGLIDNCDNVYNGSGSSAPDQWGYPSAWTGPAIATKTTSGVTCAAGVACSVSPSQMGIGSTWSKANHFHINTPLTLDKGQPNQENVTVTGGGYYPTNNAAIVFTPAQNHSAGFTIDTNYGVCDSPRGFGNYADSVSAANALWLQLLQPSGLRPRTAIRGTVQVSGTSTAH
jgi:hypothetical protein